MQADDAPAVVGEAVKGIVENADRLGLTWGWQLAQVDQVLDASKQRYSCTYDGDTESIPMICVTGNILVPGQRVYAVKVPPSANFIVGFAEARVLFAYKPKTTSLNSDVFATDANLFVTVPPGSRFYSIEMMLRVANSATGVGIKLALRGPTNSRVTYAGAGPAFANTSNEGDGAWFAPGSTTGLTAGAFFGVGGAILTFPWGISVKGACVTTGQGGRIGWDMSQVINTPANPTLVLQDSWMEVTDRGPAV